MSIIEVANLHKNFKIYSDKGKTLKERLLFKKRRTFEMREVLKGIDVSIEKGEAVGLIGHNGCGKSTLLKILTKILYPNAGEIKIDGRVSSLLELGAGFHPDLTGLENIYANAAIFGLKKKEIDDRLQTIIDFSELEGFIDNPVRTYSSGMYMRLAFSVAINVNADILLVDEILAVGDANFQQKCFRKMRELRDSGVTIVLVTHAMETVKMFCTRALWLNDGKIQIDGNPAEVVEAYMDYMDYQQFLNARRHEIMLLEKRAQAGEITEKEKEEMISQAHEEYKVELRMQEKSHFGSQEVLLRDAYFVNSDGVVVDDVFAGDQLTLEMDYEILNPQDGYIFEVGIETLDRKELFSANTTADNMDLKQLPKSGWVKMQINDLDLEVGEYILKIGIFNSKQEELDIYNQYKHFKVESRTMNEQKVLIPHFWEAAEAGEL